LGVDLATPAEEGDRGEVRLAIDPLGPEPPIGLETAPAHIRDGRKAGLDQLVVEGEGTALLHQLLKARVVATGREVGGEQQVEADRARPLQIQAAEKANHRTADLHARELALLASPAATDQAEVGAAAAAGSGRAYLAAEAAGIGHLRRLQERIDVGAKIAERSRNVSALFRLDQGWQIREHAK